MGMLLVPVSYTELIELVCSRVVSRAHCCRLDDQFTETTPPVGPSTKSCIPWGVWYCGEPNQYALDGSIMAVLVVSTDGVWLALE
jgi:hypothetical protein